MDTLAAEIPSVPGTADADADVVAVTVMDVPRVTTAATATEDCPAAWMVSPRSTEATTVAEVDAVGFADPDRVSLDAPVAEVVDEGDALPDMVSWAFAEGVDDAEMVAVVLTVSLAATVTEDAADGLAPPDRVTVGASAVVVAADAVTDPLTVSDALRSKDETPEAEQDACHVVPGACVGSRRMTLLGVPSPWRR